MSRIVMPRPNVQTTKAGFGLLFARDDGNESPIIIHIPECDAVHYSKR
jgi:hypothetical protein